MIQSYISNKNYAALYINTVGIKFVSALVLTFVGAHLYTEGLSLALVFLYFGAEFLLRGILTPLGGVITGRLGFKKAVIIANALLALYFVALGFYDTWHVIGFFSFTLHAMSRAIYYPAKHYMQAKFVQEFNRGRFLTLEIIIASITGSLAVLGATYSVTVLDSFWPVVVASGLLLSTSSLAILFVLGSLDHERTITYGDTVKYCLSRSFRRDLVGFIGFGVNVGFNNVVVSLLVFFAVASLKLFGIIMAAIALVEMCITLLFGRYIDANRLKSSQKSTVWQVVSYGLFFGALTPLLATVTKTIYNTVWNLFDSSFTARFHSKIARNGLVYACAKEVTLGIGAALYCLSLATIAVFLSPATVFYCALVLAAVSALVAQKGFQD